MAISTYKTFLMKKGSGSTYEKVVDIKSFPQLGGSPNLLDTTSLSNKMRTNILGIQDVQGLEFTANYTKADYTTVKALEGQSNEYSVWFGGTESGGTLTPTGTDGKYNFTGELSVYINGGGVDEVVEMTITIAASTDIVPGE